MWIPCSECGTYCTGAALSDDGGPLCSDCSGLDVHSEFLKAQGIDSEDDDGDDDEW